MHTKVVTFSLTELIRGVLEEASAQGLTSFPPLDHRLWHQFLYSLCADSETPKLFREVIGSFRWGGEHPVSEDLREALPALSLLWDTQERNPYRVGLKLDLIPIRKSKSFSNCPEFEQAIKVAFQRTREYQNFLGK